MVKTSKAIFTFGTDKKCNQVKYLSANSKNWKVGKNKIPGFFAGGCAIEVKSKGEIWLIGGAGKSNKRILSFDVENLTFKELPMKLNVGRYGHNCIVTKIGNSEVILVTGGIEEKIPSCEYLNSVEIINIDTGSVTLISWMNIRRTAHGIGTLNIENQPRIAVFGGMNNSGTRRKKSIEIFDKETLQWELLDDITMNEARDDFGYLVI